MEFNPLAGRAVAILGGGPSLRLIDKKLLRGFVTLAVNESYRIEPPDVLYFNDPQWFLDHKADVLDLVGWGTLAVTGSVWVAQNWPDIELFSPRLPGDNSGLSAFHLALALQARTIVLAGFDCRRQWGRSHWHDRYDNDAATYVDFLSRWSGAGDLARIAGVDVANVSQGSAITEFRHARIEEIARAEA